MIPALAQGARPGRLLFGSVATTPVSDDTETVMVPSPWSGWCTK